MIRLTFIISLILTHPSYAGLVWESKTVELKAEPGQSSATVEFPFRNDGEEAVDVVKVSTSCGCTTASIDKRRYVPGEAGSIKGVFDFGPREGMQTKLFRVLTSDGKHETLYFKVDIPVLYTFPGKMFVWKASGSNTQSRVCRLLNQSSKSIKIESIKVQSIKGASSAFDAALKEVKPGFEYELTIAPKDVSHPAHSIIILTTEPIPGNRPRVYRLYAIIR